MGIVSGRNRRWRNRAGSTIEGVLQIDAATNPGSSGGPVVDVDGNVIAMSVGGRKDMDNLSYCIPGSTIAAILPELLGHGGIERATLGVRLSVVARDGNEETLTVVGVGQGESTFSVGDVIVSVDGTALRHRADLFRVMDRSRIDKELEVVVRRGADEVPLTARAQRKEQ
jgi:serine protease Do